MQHAFTHQYHQPGVSDWQSHNLPHQQAHNYPNAQAQAAAAAQAAAVNQQNLYGRGGGGGGPGGNNGFNQGGLGDARGLGGAAQGLGARDLGGQGFGGGRDMGRDGGEHAQGFGGQRDVGAGGAGGMTGAGSVGGDRDNMSEDNRKVLDWIAQTLNANTREAALLELSKKREQVSELALILWHSFGMS